MISTAEPPNERKKDRPAPLHRPPFHHEQKRANSKWPNEAGRIECDSKLTYNKRLRQWTIFWIYQMDRAPGENQTEPTVAAIDPGVVNFIT
ncbi:hypothetical protein HK104_008092, partial [Borealophlyctis nickersoniae]